MDYEKKYKEAFKEAEKIHKFSSDIAEIKRMEQIFPELAESDDEKIRKALIKGFNECLVSSSHYPKNAIKYWHGIVIEDIVAWLEKQSNQDEWTQDDEQYLLICKNALYKYQISDKWDADIIYGWLKRKIKGIKL